MPLRILIVLCVFCVCLAFGAASCASRTTNAAPTAKRGVHSSPAQPVIIIHEKSGDPLDETIIHHVYCPCYATYTDEVI